MSWVRLVESSMVLTRRGWTAVRNVGSEITLMGVDRAGRPAMATVLTEREQSVRPVFFGTRSAAGWLAPDTRLVADGGPVVASDLVYGDVREARFETHMDILEANSAGELVWSAVMRSACIVANEVMVIPKRGRQLDTAAMWIQIIERQGRPYVVLKKDEFIRAMRTDWAKTVWALSPILHYPTPEGGHRCPLESSDIVTWMLSALRASNRGHVVSFQTLQFSPYIELSMQQEHPLPLERGACAFLRAEEEPAVALFWQESSWAPILAGFVVAPSTA